MTDFLIHLAALSLGGALATLILLATSRLTRTRYAARWRCLAWLLLCLRLVIPFPLFLFVPDCRFRCWPASFGPFCFSHSLPARAVSWSMPFSTS